MATKIEQGRIGQQVRRGVKARRQALALTLDQLSVRLSDAGRPIPPNGLYKIEAGERRVDVDDVSAFAEALGVTTRWLERWGHSDLPALPTEQQEAALKKAGNAIRRCEAHGLTREAVLDWLQHDDLLMWAKNNPEEVARRAQKDPDYADLWDAAGDRKEDDH